MEASRFGEAADQATALPDISVLLPFKGWSGETVPTLRV